MVLGLSIAAPIGAMGVLVIHRTLARGRLAGFLTGLGVASADAIYASFAAFGIAVLSNLLISLAAPVRLIGGLFLLYLGVKTLRSAPVDTRTAPPSDTKSAYLSDYLSALGLTITNPMTILMFAGIFTGAGFTDMTTSEAHLAPLIVIGTFLGSTLWWVILTTLTGILRTRFTPRLMVWVNRISGAVIIGFALVTLAGLFGASG